MADIMNLADAIVSAMNANSFSQSFTSRVVDVPATALEDLSGVTVEAVVSDDSGSMMDRRQVQHDAAIDIGVQKKILRIDQDPQLTDFRAMLQLAQEVVDFWWDESKNVMAGFGRLAVTNKPLYVAEWLRDKSVFFTVVHLTYKIAR